MKRKCYFVLFFVCLAGYAGADTVEMPLSNASFEANSWTTSGLETGLWWLKMATMFEPDGVFMADNYPGQSVPDGLRLLQLGSTKHGSYAIEPLGVLLDPDSIYTIRVDIGSRSSFPYFPGGNAYFGMRLRYVDPDSDIIFGSDNLGVSDLSPAVLKWSGPSPDPETGQMVVHHDMDGIVSGEFTTYTLTLDGSTITDPNGIMYGKELALALEAGAGIIMDFDNVTATVSNPGITAVTVDIISIPAEADTINIKGTHTYAQGTELSLNAKWFVDCPDVYPFDHWEIDSVPYSSETEIIVALDNSMTITAVFNQNGQCVEFPAEDIPIVNSDFESPQYGDPEWVSTYEAHPFYRGKVSAGWTSFVPAWQNQVWFGRILHIAENSDPSNNWDWYYPGVDQTPYGMQQTYIWKATGWSQQLDAALTANTTYTLEFDHGWPIDHLVAAGGDAGWLLMQLKVNEEAVFTGGVDMYRDPPVVVGTVGAVQTDDVGLQLPTVNGWKHQTLTYTTDSAPIGMGEPLSIVFHGDHGMSVDNISLHKSAFTTAATNLTISINSPGSVVPDSSVTPSPGAHVYPYNTKVSLIAERYVDCPDVYEFDHWEGDAADPSSATTSVTMGDNKTLTAVYVIGGECGDECHPIDHYDSDSNCDIDVIDLAAFAGAWLNCTSVECLNN